MVDQLLGARADDHLIPGANHASGLMQIPGDLFPENRFSLTVAFGQEQVRGIPQDIGHTFGPRLEIKGGGVGFQGCRVAVFFRGHIILLCRFASGAVH